MSAPTPLLTPLKRGRWNLPNRVAYAPLTRGRATDDFIPTDIMIEYYSQRSDSFQITEGIYQINCTIKNVILSKNLSLFFTYLNSNRNK